MRPSQGARWGQGGASSQSRAIVKGLPASSGRRQSGRGQIGTKRKNPPRLKLEHPNAIKRALHYKELLDSGQVDSQGELSRLSGTPRTTISAYLRLLGLDEEVRAEALNLSDEDERVARLTEPRLRHLVGLQPAEQLRRFRALLDATEPHEASRRVR